MLHPCFCRISPRAGTLYNNMDGQGTRQRCAQFALCFFRSRSMALVNFSRTLLLHGSLTLLECLFSAGRVLPSSKGALPDVFPALTKARPGVKMGRYAPFCLCGFDEWGSGQIPVRNDLWRHQLLRTGFAERFAERHSSTPSLSFRTIHVSMNALMSRFQIVGWGLSLTGFGYGLFGYPSTMRFC